MRRVLAAIAVVVILLWIANGGLDRLLAGESCVITALGQEICGEEKIGAWCRATEELRSEALEFGDYAALREAQEICATYP